MRLTSFVSFRRPSDKSQGRLLQRRHLALEALEVRTLLSVAVQLPAGWEAQPSLSANLVSGSNSTGSSIPYGLTPNQIRGAYGLGTYQSGVLTNPITFSGIKGDGSGQTIAIIDAYDDPYALGDLNAFSAYFGLPTFGGGGSPTFQKRDENGGASLPGTDPTGPWWVTGSLPWEVEESLDIEWAHVMAPMANIILFEAADTGEGLFTALQTAANTSGVVAISMSWSGSEFFGETTIDSEVFVTPAGHVGGASSLGGTGLPGDITFLASTGDSGAYDSQNTSTITPQWPACSPNVVAVGGTSLTVAAGNAYGSETTWGNGTSSGASGGGGGGISVYESQPSYQNGVVDTYSTTARTYPDVSADANPSTGVPIYDSWDFGDSTPWVPGKMGGTSLSCPLWAGMVAVADQGRAIAGLGSLDGASQTLPELYQTYEAASTDFHDVTSGNSIGPTTPINYGPGTGYDLATGLGSPVGNLLVPQLVGLTAPTVTAVSSTQASGAYGAGTPISITVTFSELVTVTGTPQLTLNAGSGAVANYASGSGTSTLTFTYTVAAGQNSSDLDYASTTALALNGGSIQDTVGDTAVLTLPNAGTDGLATRNITIDTTPPVVTDVHISITSTGAGPGGSLSARRHSDRPVGQLAHRRQKRRRTGGREPGDDELQPTRRRLGRGHGNQARLEHLDGKLHRDGGNPRHQPDRLGDSDGRRGQRHNHPGHDESDLDVRYHDHHYQRSSFGLGLRRSGDLHRHRDRQPAG